MLLLAKDSENLGDVADESWGFTKSQRPDQRLASTRDVIVRCSQTAGVGGKAAIIELDFVEIECCSCPELKSVSRGLLSIIQTNKTVPAIGVVRG